jgi:PAS domain S-box-containing protein
MGRSGGKQKILIHTGMRPVVGEAPGMRSRSEMDRMLKRLVHELELHQVELETQNLQLQESHVLLEESRNRYADLYDLAPVGYLTHSGNGRIEDINLAGAQLLGRDRRRLRGQPLFLWTNEEDAGVLMRHLSRCRKTTQPVTTQFALSLRGKPPLHVQMRSVCWMRNGEPSGQFLATLHDVSMQKEAEEQLRRAKDDAERASRSKNVFIANISHEIRTPLSAVLGFADCLLDPCGQAREDSERLNYLTCIKRNGEQLLRLIDDILDLSKVEAGKMTMGRELIPVRDCLLETLAVFTKQAEAKGLRLEVVIDGEVPSHIRSDRIRLKQVLWNLLSNAVKFTHAGSIVIRVSMDADASLRHPKLAFEVADTGVGIALESIAHLFEPFVQADDSVSRAYGGTGLGLTLSRRIAQLLGGNLELESSLPGEGSVFRFTVATGSLAGVPFMRELFAGKPTPRARTEEATAPNSLAGVEVLLVEDTPDNQNLVKILLANVGASVSIANNGVEGVDRALRGHFDVVLMDIQMPKMDGITATRKLRSLGYRPPILALTAHALKEEQARSLEAGCNDHLTKPINRWELVRQIQNAVGR